MNRKFIIYNLKFKIFKEGFTLIELLVVISIIGILAGLVISNVAGVRERARDVERKTDLDQIKKALRMYYNDNNAYPATILGVGEEFAGGGTTIYMKAIPGDPNTDAGYSYFRTNCVAGTDDFRLVATLENKSDSGITKSHTRCADDCGFTWDTIAQTQYVVCAD